MSAMIGMKHGMPAAGAGAATALHARRVRSAVTATLLAVALAVAAAVTGVVPGSVPAAHAADRKSTRLNSSHIQKSRMPSSA